MAAQGQMGGGEAAQQGQQGEAQGGDQSALEQGLASLTQNFQQFQQQLQPITDQQQQVAQYLESLQAQQQPPEEQGFGVDPAEFEQTFGLDRQGAEQLAGVFQQHTQDAVQQALEQFQQQTVAPLQERLSELQWGMDASQLASEIPDLQDPEKAQQVMEATNQIAEAIGSPQLATHPMMVKLAAYGLMGMQMQQERQAQGDQAPPAAHMEGGGGAAPAPAQQDPTQEALQRLGFGNGQRSFGAGGHRNVLAP